MKSGPSTRVTAPPTTMASEQPPPTLRMQLKPEAPTTGHVDGAWWPRCRDLRTELPRLTAELTARIGQTERVTYNLTAWDPVAKRITTDHGVIRLDGFRSQQADTITVIGGQGGQRRLTLLVIPPDTFQGSAQDVLASASQAGNTDAVQALLAAKSAPHASTRDTAQLYSTSAATLSWEDEGGHSIREVV